MNITKERKWESSESSEGSVSQVLNVWEMTWWPNKTNTIQIMKMKRTILGFLALKNPFPDPYSISLPVQRETTGLQMNSSLARRHTRMVVRPRIRFFFFFFPRFHSNKLCAVGEVMTTGTFQQDTTVAKSCLKWTNRKKKLCDTH